MLAAARSEVSFANSSRHRWPSSASSPAWRAASDSSLVMKGSSDGSAAAEGQAEGGVIFELGEVVGGESEVGGAAGALGIEVRR